MEKAFGNMQDSRGNAIPFATLTVYDTGTTDLVTIYSDNGITPIDNPGLTNNLGEWAFYAADGNYDLILSKIGVTPQTFDDLQLLDKATIDATLSNLTGTTFDFIEGPTPSATAADEWWYDTTTGKAYKSTASGTGSWAIQYQNLIQGTTSNVVINADADISGAFTVGGIQTIDVINEKTLNAGTTIEGVELKDGLINGIDISTLTGAVGLANIDSKNLVLELISTETVDMDADSLITLTDAGISTLLQDIDETYDTTTDTVGGLAMKSSHDYQLWIDSARVLKMAPDLTGVADADVLNSLSASGMTAITDLVQVNDELFNTTDGTKGFVKAISSETVITCKDKDGADLDLFPLGTESFKIHMLSPVGLGASKGNFGKVYNDSGSDLTKVEKYGRARLTNAFFDTSNGYGATNNKIRKYLNEIIPSNDVVVRVQNIAGAAANDGFSVTANMNCKLKMAVSENFNAANYGGISLNSTQLSTGISAITASDRLAICMTHAANQGQQMAINIIMEKGDIVRVHASGNADGATPALASVYLLAEEIV